jgi:hypothetical protein
VFSCLLYATLLRIDLCSLSVKLLIFLICRMCVITLAVILHDYGMIRVIGNILTVILSCVPTYSDI